LPTLAQAVSEMKSCVRPEAGTGKCGRADHLSAGPFWPDTLTQSLTLTITMTTGMRTLVGLMLLANSVQLTDRHSIPYDDPQATLPQFATEN
jgi:hypothetical protein